MRLRKFGEVYSSETIIIRSKKDVDEGRDTYTIQLVRIKEMKIKFFTLPEREDAEAEVIRLLTLYTSLTATERRRVARICRRKK